MTYTATTAYPEAQGFMPTQVDADELRVALEAVTGDDYTDFDLATMTSITRQRISDLQPEADQEGPGSACSFEQFEAQRPLADHRGLGIGLLDLEAAVGGVHHRFHQVRFSCFLGLEACGGQQKKVDGKGKGSHL